MNHGPLVLVDDDAEDQELLMTVLRKAGFTADIIVFSNANDALDFLYGSELRPFLILSDVNMPKMDGLAFKRTIENCDILRPKCIPFVFLSTAVKGHQDMCDLNVQGYFQKGNSLQDLEDTVKVILAYWRKTKHLN